MTMLLEYLRFLLCIAVVGLGEIIGGLLFGIFGKFLDKFVGRTPRVLLGFAVNCVAYIIAFINLPFDATFG